MTVAARCWAGVLALLAAAPAVRAQQPIPVDRIVAIVGTQPILASQVEEELAQAQATGQTVPQDSAGRDALRHRIVISLVDMELMVQQALHDTTVKVTEQEVQDAVESTVRNVRNRFTAETEFQRQLLMAGFGGVEEWRRWLIETQRRSILSQRLQEQLRQKQVIKPIPPTEAQMHVFWEENRGATERRPAVASFRQIVMLPSPDSAARAAARATAESLLTALRAGADFAATARANSCDSASRDSGGTLGWFRRGTMVKPFEMVAFRLRPGEVSGIVETSFGYHIIQVDRVQPAEVLARHVLVCPAISRAQIEVARALAESLHTVMARTNGAAFDSLARLYADENAPKLVEAVPLTALAPEYQRLLAADSTPGLKPVLVLSEGSGRPRFVVFELTRRQPEGETTFDDVREQIRSKLSQDLGLQHYLDRLRRQTYIDIRL
jgi:peptidyl-prolyl cis-trans isomerase SurA